MINLGNLDYLPSTLSASPLPGRNVLLYSMPYSSSEGQDIERATEQDLETIRTPPGLEVSTPTDASFTISGGGH